MVEVLSIQLVSFFSYEIQICGVMLSKLKWRQAINEVQIYLSLALDILLVYLSIQMTFCPLFHRWVLNSNQTHTKSKSVSSCAITTVPKSFNLLVHSGSTYMANLIQIELKTKTKIRFSLAHSPADCLFIIINNQRWRFVGNNEN